MGRGRRSRRRGCWGEGVGGQGAGGFSWEVEGAARGSLGKGGTEGGTRREGVGIRWGRYLAFGFCVDFPHPGTGRMRC